MPERVGGLERVHHERGSLRDPRSCLDRRRRFLGFFRVRSSTLADAYEQGGGGRGGHSGALSGHYHDSPLLRFGSVRRRNKPALRLRSTAGLLEDMTLSIPAAWHATLRERAKKLGISVEELSVQALGHVSSEAEKVAKPPELGDDPARLVLRDSLRESYRRESVRTGLGMRELLHRAVQAAADEFDGRRYEAAPAPVRLVPKRAKETGS